jgi:hypothetical protein
MTASIYTRLAATSLKLLTKYGQRAILRPQSTGGYVPGNSSATLGGSLGQFDEFRQVLPTDQPGQRIAQQFGQSLQNGTLLQKSDKWVYVDAAGRKPGLTDILILGGVSFNIIDSQEVDPGGKALLYLIVLRA